MASYLDDLSQYNSEIQVRFAELAKEARILLEASKDAQTQSDDVNWWQQLIVGSNDLNQTADLRLTLLTLLVDNARLNEVPLIDVFGLTQAIGDATISATTWDLIGGDLNDNAQLIAKFNQYLPLTAGVTKPLTGALYFATDGLGIDVLNETDTLNIGASAGVVQFGLDAEVKLNVITEGAWQGTNIGVTYGGLGSLNFAGGTDGQAIVKSGAGYAFYTIPAIPSLTGYIKADGTVPMTADLRFSPSFGIDTTGAGTLNIGRTNATAVSIIPSLTVSTIVAGTWNGSVIGLGYGGTGASLSIPANNSFFIYSDDNTTSEFATIGDNLSYSGGSVALAQVITGSNRWRADVVEVAYGGTGLNDVGAEGDVLTVVSGAPAWATFTALTNPMDDAGQMIYGGVAGVPTKLEPNATSTNRFLRSVSSGDPSWQILVAGDIPTISQSQVSGLTTALTNKLSTVLTDGYMYVGNAANAAVGVEMYGDATIDNSGSLLIADEAVTFAKMQNITATTLVGRWSAGDGPMQEVTIGSGLSLSITGVLTSGGLVNPMTTIGDMIIGDTGGDPIRLAAGTNGYILTMVSGSPAWAVAASGGGNVVGPGPTVVSNNFAVYNGTGGLTIGEPTGASLDGSGNATFLSVRVNGTGGAGHMHFRHQASAVAGTGNSNTIYALPVASNGFGFVINNAAYASSLVFGASAARTYTLPDTSGTFAFRDVANSWSAGVKQTFAPDATNAGVNVGTLAGQPSSPVNGDLVYNSSATALQAYINGAWVSLGAGGGGSSALSAITAATAGNTINNLNFAQVWNWSTLNTGTGFTFGSTALTSGSLLALTHTTSSLTGNLASFTSTGITTGNLLNLGISGSTAVSADNLVITNSSTANTSGRGLDISITGATASGNTFGAFISNTKSGATSTNTALSLTASGGTTNYALDVTAGIVRMAASTASLPHMLFTAGAAALTATTNGMLSYATVSSNSSFYLYKDSAVTTILTTARNPDFATGAQGVVVADSSGNFTKSADLTALGIFAQTSDVTTTATGATTIFGTISAGSLTLPANFFAVGKTIRITAEGKITSPVTAGTIAFVFSIGSTVLTVTSPTLSVSLTDKFYKLTLIATCRTIGASGTVFVSGELQIDMPLGSAYVAPVTGTNTINTTGTLALNVTSNFSAASHSITTSLAFGEYLN
jgi:hypothetical protein